ncbi:MAG: hypothetical protein RMJ52_07915 [Gemmataceae bacterium]|nr:hypothetical protein [Gemmataceae bacterium]
MATIYFPNGGELLMLESGLTGDNAWSVRLFTNDHTPGPQDTTPNYTEAAFAGYVPASLVRKGPAATDADGRAVQEYQMIEWHFTGNDPGPQLYGFFIVTPNGQLVCACRFDDPPITLSQNDPYLRVIPRLRPHNP